MKQPNKPSGLVIAFMWLQIVSLILALLLIVIAFVIDSARGKGFEPASLVVVVVLVAFTVFGVFTARSILRGYHWAWYFETIYTIPMLMASIETIAKFRGFVMPTDFRSFMDGMIHTVKVPFGLAAPFLCLRMAREWRNRESMTKNATDADAL